MPIVNFMMIYLIVGQIKKIPLNKMSYYPELDTGTNKKKFELDLSKYKTKSEVKLNTSHFA